MAGNKKMDSQKVRDLLSETRLPRDKLPYTDEFDRLHIKYCDDCESVTKHELMIAFFNEAKKGGHSGRKSSEKRTLQDRDAIFVGKYLGNQLASRAKLVYTREFKDFYQSYKKSLKSELSLNDFWLLVDGVAKKAKGDEWRKQLEKARESACLAVEIYNKPLVKFRTYSYIILMVVAWTALLHAAFFRWGIKPFYRQVEGGREYKKIDGDYCAWELKSCLDNYFGDKSSPVKENAKFFIGLRNKIEHRSLPELDPFVFGECQAFLLNFEDLLFNFELPHF